MDSQSCEDTVSIASNDAFEEFKVAPYYHNTAGLSADGSPAGLPLSITHELIPRLDRVIQLLETQLNCPRQPDSRQGHGEPKAVIPSTQRSIKSIKNEVRAAKRRSRNIRAKARAKFFQKNNGSTLPKVNGGSTREEFNAARRGRSTKFLTSCWPESEDPYDEDASYKIYPEYRSPKVSMSW